MSMMERMTSTPASVKPPSSTSPRLVRRPIQSISRRVAVHVVDARLSAGRGVGCGRVDRQAAGVGGIGGGGELLPVGLLADRILGDGAQVLRALQLLEVGRVLLLVSVV